MQLVTDITSKENLVTFFDKDLIEFLLNNPIFVWEKSMHPFHYSKEPVYQSFLCWLYQKNSKWQELLNSHILIFHQAKLGEYLDKWNLVKQWEEEDNTLDKLNFEHTAAAFIILGFGLVTSALGTIK
ncbi:uncharacterized protein LOC111697111 [Eurytemora carolleeae]|uniref:uncharacterized protein LOC111697111 n=1 Tax=Eurytemora carolleeae TaxID=1294199 RepID=UPI000C78E73E|nr:uncharacterized protein LOC111697111 [Eurytemora carolleeae]|eukprot:XP_023322768.1 uncharacterized protein LOC111697111 [Eurytemora affinis]